MRHERQVHFARLAAGLVFAWAGLLSGCQRDQAYLKVANWAGPEELAVERANVLDFEQQHPGVRVEVETIPSNYREKLLTGFASGIPPDVFLLDATMAADLLDRHLLLDLLPYCREHRVDLSQYYPNVLAIAQRGSGLYALPKDFTPLVIFCNRKLFTQAGLACPTGSWTWQQFLTLAQKLTRDTDGDGVPEQYGTVTYPHLDSWPPWVWSNGGDFLDPTGHRASGYLDSPATLEALGFLADLHRRYRVAPSPMMGERLGGEATLLYTGRIAMLAGGHWLLPMLEEHIRSGRLDVVAAPIPHPAGKAHRTVLYEAGWAVARRTRRPDVAAELAVFLSSTTANRRRLALRLAIPANISLAQEALHQDSTGLEKVLYHEIGAARMPWGAKVEGFGRVQQIAEDAFEQTLIGGRPLAETMTAAAVHIDRELAAPRPTSGSQRAQVWGFVAISLLVALGLALRLLRQTRQHRDEARAAWLFLAPSYLHVVVFLFAPILFSLYLALHRWSIADPRTAFVGVGNFAELARDREFWRALLNTLIYSLHVPVAMAVSLGLALALNRRMRLIGLLRVLFFIPSVSSLVAVAIVWQWLYNTDYGLLNYALRAAGLSKVGWLTNPHCALASVMLMSIWMTVGYQSVLFLAGLQGIPRQLQEAAMIDGAGRWRRFRHITLPMLRPTVFFVLVTSIIASWQVFTPVYVMTQGGPLHATDVAVFHVYQSAWEHLRMGYASAMAWVLFILLVVATYLQFRALGKEGGFS
jgi:multiple sugar transport system permease protein